MKLPPIPLFCEIKLLFSKVLTQKVVTDNRKKFRTLFFKMCFHFGSNSKSIKMIKNSQEKTWLFLNLEKNPTDFCRFSPYSKKDTWTLFVFLVWQFFISNVNCLHMKSADCTYTASKKSSHPYKAVFIYNSHL